MKPDKRLFGPRLLLGFFAFLVVALLPAISLAAPPVIYYSDIVSGPNTGGQNNKGAFVRVFGKNFGAIRGTSAVTIGGGQADNYSTWSDTQVSFQLGAAAATGNIVVTTIEGASNGVPFTVRAGRIFFISASSPNNPGSGTYADPWRLADSFYDGAAAGDIAYLRAGTYGSEYGYTGWGSVFGLRVGTGAGYTATGTSANPIAYLAYPGEVVTIQADTGGAPQIGFRAICASPPSCATAPDWIVIGNFKILAWNDCVDGSTTKGWRIVNNECHGITRNTALWGGSIAPGGDNAKVLGNIVTGGRSGSKMDHAIYSGACATDVEIAWNNIYDNNFARGPLIVVNYEGARCVAGQYAGNAWIHDNIVDSTIYPSRCIGIYAQSYLNGDPVIPVSTVYNNLLINCGVVDVDGIQAAMFVGNGAAEFYNNTLYNTNTMALDLGGFEPYIPYVNVKYNIFHMKAGSASNYYTFGSLGAYLHPEKNLYFGLGNYAGSDPSPVNADPGFVNPAVGNYHLRQDSAARNAANLLSDPLSSADPTRPIAPRDLDGVRRLSDSYYDLGAYEYTANTIQNPPQRLRLNP